GLCAITMPVALDSAGMPVGLQCMARAHGEDALLAAAAAIEGILGTPAQRLGRAPLGA
ncbi:MAG: amidase, partial [Alphaproteobacteria bacterium]